MSRRKYSDVNYYDLLGIDINAEQTTIRKAYRKKALECHPDKNPDNPKAAELFHELSKALEILTDESARKAYDAVLKSKKAALLRTQQLDSKRQKFKADLEERERRAAAAGVAASYKYSTIPKSAEEILEEEIQRLRREGSIHLQEEREFLLEQMKKIILKDLKKKQDESKVFDSSQHRIKIKWKADKKDETNGGYSEEKLLKYLRKYGDVEAFVMSKKNGSAMVEFKSLDACEMALKYEKGIMENPLSMEWATTPVSKKEQQTENPLRSTFDYEDLVMRQMRHAEERQRLIEELKKGEAELEEGKS